MGREHRLSAVVEKPRAQAAIGSLRAEGVYDDSRSVRECGEGAVAIPVTDHPAETAVTEVVREEGEPRLRTLEDHLREAGWSDAELDRALSTSPPVARSATAGTPFELKTCQPRKASDGRPGQWIFHEEPHEFLTTGGGRYLLAVIDELELERWVVCGPRDLEHGLTWYDCPGTQGYQRQAHIEWPVVIGEVSWTSRGRRGRIPDDGGESA